MIEKMTVTQALVELKLLDARICKKIDESATFAVALNTKTDPRKPEDLEKNIKAAYQSVSDMIDRRDAIKRAVVLSNATKTIEIKLGGNMKRFTVAEIIDMKNNGIGYRARLMRKLISDGNEALRSYRSLYEAVNKQALAIAAAAQSQPKITPEEAANLSIYQEYMEANKITMVDPLDVGKLAEQLDSEISDFQSIIDTTLSVVNATTEITVRYGADADTENEPESLEGVVSVVG